MSHLSLRDIDNQEGADVCTGVIGGAPSASRSIVDQLGKSSPRRSAAAGDARGEPSPLELVETGRT
jgi:hypothetical protein